MPIFNLFFFSIFFSSNISQKIRTNKKICFFFICETCESIDVSLSHWTDEKEKEIVMGQAERKGGKEMMTIRCIEAIEWLLREFNRIRYVWNESKIVFLFRSAVWNTEMKNCLWWRSETNEMHNFEGKNVRFSDCVDNRNLFAKENKNNFPPFPGAESLFMCIGFKMCCFLLPSQFKRSK